MIKAVALGLTLVVTALLTGCGIVVTDEAPPGDIRASAPSVLSTFPEVAALAPAPTRTLSLGKARRLARKAALEIRIPACDDDPLGRGFALDAHTLVAHRDAVPGGGWVRVDGEPAIDGNRSRECLSYRRARRHPGRPPAAAEAGVRPERRCRGVGGGRHRARRQAAAVARRDRGQRPRGAVRREDEGASPELGCPGRGRGPCPRCQGTDRRRGVRGRRGTSLGLAVPVSALRGRAARRAGEALDACG